MIEPDPEKVGEDEKDKENAGGSPRFENSCHDGYGEEAHAVEPRLRHADSYGTEEYEQQLRCLEIVGLDNFRYDGDVQRLRLSTR